MIIDWEKINFQPYDRDNLIVPGLDWHLMTYNRETGEGTYLLRYQPNTKTKPHKHMVFEEFIILSGILYDSCGDVYRENDLVHFEKNTVHYTYTRKLPCTVFVISGGENRLAKL